MDSGIGPPGPQEQEECFRLLPLEGLAFPDLQFADFIAIADVASVAEQRLDPGAHQFAVLPFDIHFGAGSGG